MEATEGDARELPLGRSCLASSRDASPTSRPASSGGRSTPRTRPGPGRRSETAAETTRARRSTPGAISRREGSSWPASARPATSRWPMQTPLSSSPRPGATRSPSDSTSRTDWTRRPGGRPPGPARSREPIGRRPDRPRRRCQGESPLGAGGRWAEAPGHPRRASRGRGFARRLVAARSVPRPHNPGRKVGGPAVEYPLPRRVGAPSPPSWAVGIRPGAGRVG